MPAKELPAPAPRDPPGSFLFSDEVIEELTDQERKHGIYTAERLPADKREAVIKLLSENRQVRDIAKLIRVAPESITAVANHPIYGPQIKSNAPLLAGKLRRVAFAQLERIERCPDLLPAASIPFATTAWIDKAELLDGRATARIEHTERIDIFGDYDAWLAELEKEYEQKIAAAAPAIGLAGEKLSAIDAELVNPGPELQLPGGPPAELEGNSELRDSSSFPQADPGELPTYAPSSSPDPGPQPVDQLRDSETPGGGSMAATRPAAPTDNPSQNFPHIDL